MMSITIRCGIAIEMSPGVTSSRVFLTGFRRIRLQVERCPRRKSPILCRMGLPPPMVVASLETDLPYRVVSSSGSVSSVRTRNAKFVLSDRRLLRECPFVPINPS